MFLYAADKPVDFQFWVPCLYPEFKLQMSRDRSMDRKITFVLVALFLLFHAFPSFPQAAIQPNQTQTPPRARVIVFVHGLHGSRESWRASNGAYWPDLIRRGPRFAYSAL